MEHINKLDEIVWITAIIISSFLAIWFSIQMKKSKAFIYVSLLFVCIAINYIDVYLYLHRLVTVNIITYVIRMPTAFLMPVSTILYLFCFTSSVNEKPPKWVYLFFLLAVLFFLYAAYVHFFLYPFRGIQANFYHIKPSNYYQIFLIRKLWRFLHIGGLLTIMVSSIYFMPGIIRSAEKEYSNAHEHIVKRFLILLSLAIILCVVDIIFYMSGRHFFYGTLLSINGYVFIGYLMYKESLFEYGAISLSPINSPNDKPLLERVIRYFEDVKPWYNPYLKLDDVAIALGTNRTYLSSLFKDELQTNFNRFVNGYRVAEAKRLLNNEGKNAKMNVIALKAGFNGYTTFFSAFRKETGISPKKFVSTNNSFLKVNE